MKKLVMILIIFLMMVFFLFSESKKGEKDRGKENRSSHKVQI
jgi:cbb3-type cytochrome oxidase subunit 3